MPKMIPIHDLKNTNDISKMCHESNEPIFVTKNGYDDLVIMSMDLYEEKMRLLDVYQKLGAAEEQLLESKVLDANISLTNIRKKYNV